MAMPVASDPFTAALREPDLMDKLASSAEIRKHMADPGFIQQIEKLRDLANDPDLQNGDMAKTAAVGQKIAGAGHKDPRVMQALMFLQGQGLVVDETDLKKAESVGDMQRREPVQLEQLLLVKDLTDPEEAKTKGNEYFKAGDLSAALAHYQKGFELLKSQDEVPAVRVATLLSNSSQCLLKLKWPDRAKKSVSMALAALKQAEDTTFDQSKLFYRRSLACEGLGDFSGAVDDMSRALQHAKKSSQSLAEQHRLKGEVDRLKKIKLSAEAEAEKKREQKENEKVAEVQRLQGAQVKAKDKSSGGYSNAPVSSEYLTEQDFSHWAKGQVTSAVIGVTHKAQSGAKVEITKMQEQSKVNASITTKKGNRSLYYDMDLHLQWKGTYAGNEMDGLIRVYNIAHDTKFQLGGDENTSYMYQMGWDQRVSGEWCEELKNEAVELFDLVAVKVDGVIKELRKK